MDPNKMSKAVEKALRAYHKTGARDLPSVTKSVPRPFRDAVDALVASLETAVEEAKTDA